MARTGEEALKKRETGSLIAADKVEGTGVYNTAGDKLGSVERMMIDKRSGRVAYAVMSFGGFLGIGDRHHPLPWGVLRYDPETGGYVINLDIEALKGAPTISENDAKFDWDDRKWGATVHDYYRVPPYWQ